MPTGDNPIFAQIGGPSARLPDNPVRVRILYGFFLSYGQARLDKMADEPRADRMGSPILSVVQGGEGSEARLPPPHVSVDMGAVDPARIEGTARERRCVAAKSDGERCGAAPPKEEIYCSAHSGRLDASSGGQARAAKLRREREEAHALAVEARLGTRAVVARVLTDRHDDVRAVVNGLLDDALDGSLPPRERRACRLALLPFVDQALGKPRESVEVTVPSSVADVEDMSLEELLAARAALAT